MYGIACFSGIYDDWTVENNIIMTNTWYGIAFNDVRNCRIINNTVCRYDTANEALPAIVISGGMKNFPCVVRNNLCAVISIEGDSTCQNDHNLFIGDPEEYFLDYRNRDLRLKPRCAAIDNGSPELAPADDISGVARPRGMGVDVGAYEYVAPLAIRAADIARVGFNKPALTNRNVFRVCDLRGRATIQRGSASGVYVVSAKNGKSRISSAAIIRQLN
jgi:parallel beta-helix repeat protein